VDGWELAIGCNRSLTVAARYDELQDEHEMRDPKIKAAIRKGYREYLAGKTRPIEEFFAARALCNSCSSAGYGGKAKRK